MQLTPEKKRVTWRPVVQEVQFCVDEQEQGLGEPGARYAVRWDFVKQCEKDIRDDSCNSDANVLEPSRDDGGSAAIRVYSARCSRFGDREVETLKDTSAVLIDSEFIPSKEIVAATPSDPSPSQEVVIDIKRISEAGGLSDADKHAAMKRRYAMLQENQRMPMEEERRLKRERLRCLVPLWRPKKMDCAH